MKKGWLFAFFLLTAMSFISAQSSLSDLLSQIDQSTVLFLALFLISFALIFFALNKVFKGNTSISGIISLALSFLIVYGINKSGFNVEGSLSDIGISSNILYILLPILIAAVIIYLIVKFGKKAWYAIGAILVILGIFIIRDVVTIITLGAIVLLFVFIIKGVLKFTGISTGKPMSHAEAARRNIDAGAGI